MFTSAISLPSNRVGQQILSGEAKDLSQNPAKNPPRTKSIGLLPSRTEGVVGAACTSCVRNIPAARPRDVMSMV